MKKIKKVSVYSILPPSYRGGQYKDLVKTRINENSRVPRVPFANRWQWKILTALEISFSIIAVWFTSYTSLYISYAHMSVNEPLKYPIDFQLYFAFFLCLLLPILLLISMWKRVLNYTKYGFLVIGIICILSGIAILATYIIVPNEPLSRGFSECKITNPFLLLPFAFVPNIGIGCILRYCHIQHYQNCYHLAALKMSYHESPEAFKRLLTMLLLHLLAYPANMIGISLL